MKKTIIFLAEGFEEAEAVLVIDVLRRAEIKVDIVSITNSRAVVGAHGIAMVADGTLGDIDNDYDALILPGGMPGTSNLDANEKVKQMILEFKTNRKLLAAICAAPLVFGKLGVLKNKKATCYPSFEEHLHGADVVNEDVVVDGDVITGKGPGTALAFGLAIVEKLLSKSISESVRTAMIA